MPDEPMRFSAPVVLNGDALRSELEQAGYTPIDVVLIDTDEVTIEALTSGGNPIGEQSRSAIQAILDAHSGALTAEQQAPLTVQQQLENGIAQMKTELSNWAPDLVQGATLNQVGARVNLISAQVQRNTERLLWLAQKLLNRFE